MTRKGDGCPQRRAFQRAARGPPLVTLALRLSKKLWDPSSVFFATSLNAADSVTGFTTWVGAGRGGWGAGYTPTFDYQIQILT